VLSPDGQAGCLTSGDNIDGAAKELAIGRVVVWSNAALKQAITTASAKCRRFVDVPTCSIRNTHCRDYAPDSVLAMFSCPKNMEQPQTLGVDLPMFGDALFERCEHRFAFNDSGHFAGFTLNQHGYGKITEFRCENPIRCNG